MGFMVIMLQAFLVGIGICGLAWIGGAKGLYPISIGDKRPIRYILLIGSFLAGIALLLWPIMSVMGLE